MSCPGPPSDRTGSQARLCRKVRGPTVEDLVDPCGIAIVGASESRYYASSLIKNLLAAGFDREALFPVHPRHEEVLGLPCYPVLEQIPHPVSLVVIATNASTAPSIIEEAGEVGARSAVVLADGYAEQGEDGRRRQEELVRVAEIAGVRILGPNTLGFLAPPQGVAVWAAGELRTSLSPGGIGVVFQSSGMLNLFLNLCIDRNMGLQAAFSVGNEVSYDTADFISYFVRSDRTRVIATLLETSNNPQRLVTALQEAQAAGKPVIALKLGTSERARANAIAHTGRMAGSGGGWDALLQRLGVVVAEDLDELVEATEILYRFAPPGIERSGKPARVGFVTISGGDCSLLADMAERVDIPLAELSSETLARLKDLLEKPDLLGNPLDTENLFREDPGRFYEAIDTFCDDSGVDVIAYRMNLPTAPTERVTTLYRQLIQRAKDFGKRPAVLTRAIEDLDESWFRFFAELDTPFLPSYRPALRSLALFSRWWGERPSVGKLALGAMPAAAKEYPLGKVSGWHETQMILKEAGVKYSPARFAVSAVEAVSAADELGYPVAVKLISSDVPHKSDIGCVELGLASSESVIASVERINDAAKAIGVLVEGYEIQSMAAGPGIEMILGMTRDPTVGPIVMMGMGGVLTELMRDVVLIVPEAEPEDVKRALGSLVGAPLLRGYRGRPPADVAALCRMVADLSHYVATAADELVALDLNPVIVLPDGDGVVAVDALAVTISRTEQQPTGTR